MKAVASLRYGVIFKKAFCDVEVFTAFVKDVLGIDLCIDKVETEKSFTPPIGNVDSRFDLYAEDTVNRIIVDIQHRFYEDHYDRFLHYHCAALLEQATNAKNYRPALKVFTIVVLTSNNSHKSAISTIYFDPVDHLTGKPLGEIPHKVLYLSPKHVTEQIPAPYYEWLSAIKDSLDEQVDEATYHHPAVLKALNLISRDNLTPQDRARMKEEYALETTVYKKGLLEGEEKGRKEGLQEGRMQEKLAIAKALKAQGMSLDAIADITGLEQQILSELT